MRYWTELGKRGLEDAAEGLGRSEEFTEVPAEEMWARVREGDPQAREEMIHRHMKVVRGVAGNLARRLPPHIDQEDLESYGYEGLIKAVDRYDPEMGPFDRFASTLVFSRIMDTLRELDWAPKALRRRARDMEKMRRTLTAQEGREPSDAELAGVLEESEAYVRQVRADVRASTFKSYHEPESPKSEHSDGQALSMLADAGPLPEDSAVLSMCKKALADWLENLPYSERVLLALYYYEEHTLAQVAAHTGRSESKVAQIHARLMLDLREALVGVLTTH